MKISVVIPTHNNAKILPECLRRILGQTLAPEEYEVIVVNDGSTDNTVGAIGEIRGIRVVNLDKNSGPSAARNVGIKEAQADLVIFIQDDILVETDFLERHLKFHQDHAGVNEVLVGHTQYDPAIPSTPFMAWWEGQQFKFKKGSYLNFYPTNLSVKKEFLVKNGMFDEEFFINGHIGYEDTELGYRLWKAGCGQAQGLALHYDSSLKVLHHHMRTLKDICEQSFYKGQLAHLLYKKHPELQKVFRDDLKYNLTRFVVNSLTIKLLEPLAYWCEKRFKVSPLFWLVCRFYYNKGYARRRSFHSLPISEA